MGYLTIALPEVVCNPAGFSERLINYYTLILRMSDEQMIKNKGSVYSRSKNGWYIINGEKFYFRSSWEVNYARYLEFLLMKKEIASWTYEEDTFWFEKIRRGVRSYTPDFKVTHNNGNIEYHEVKGWMDPKSITKIKRMKIYHPGVVLIVVDKHYYTDVLRFERMFPEATRIELEIKGA